MLTKYFILSSKKPNNSAANSISEIIDEELIYYFLVQKINGIYDVFSKSQNVLGYQFHRDEEIDCIYDFFKIEKVHSSNIDELKNKESSIIFDIDNIKKLDEISNPNEVYINVECTISQLEFLQGKEPSSYEIISKYEYNNLVSEKGRSICQELYSVL